jgi:hypothetical protein
VYVCVVHSDVEMLANSWWIRKKYDSVWMEVGAVVAQSVQCLATDWTTGRVRFDPRQRQDFSSSLCVQTGSEAHPASCTTGTGDPFSGGKARPGRDADHSPLSSAEVANEQELYILSPKRLHGMLWHCTLWVKIALRHS